MRAWGPLARDSAANNSPLGYTFTVSPATDSHRLPSPDTCAPGWRWQEEPFPSEVQAEQRGESNA